MAGGTWNSQNKVRPGVYINVKSSPTAAQSVGDRGIVALCEPLHWGPDQEMMEINTGEDLTGYIGYDLMAKETLFLREIWKGSASTAPPVKVYLYRASGTGAKKAAATIGESLSVTARYNGIRGNDIVITVTADPDQVDPQGYVVRTVLDGMVKDEQQVSDAEELKENDWVVFSGKGELATTAGIHLTEGTDGTITPTAYSDFLSVLEAYTYNILIYDGEDTIVRTAYILFMKRMRDTLGKKCQLVTSGAEGADHEAVISVGNGVVLSDGTVLQAKEATWWVGGAEAGAAYNQSLTYVGYPDAVQTYPRLSDQELEAALQEGKLVFFEEFGEIKICSDINTFTGFLPTKSRDFSKNRVMRTLDSFCNDAYKQFSKYYVGKVDNDADGRNLFKAWVAGYLNEMQANRGIKNFSLEDVEVLPGQDSDAILLNAAIQPVDSIEKIYMTVTVSQEGLS